MDPAFQVVAPDRLQIREGGGCLSVFGLPFFAAGIFVLLSVVGVIPMSTSGASSVFIWPAMSFMGLVFTALGGVLVFGRSWTIVDRTQREVIKQLGLIVPLRVRTQSIHGSDTVRLGFTTDSDSSDQFPISLRARTGADLPLCTFTSYAAARECAKALAELLRFEIEDASTDHPVRSTSSQIDQPLQTRMRLDGGLRVETPRPPDARSRVTREAGETTIVIPSRPLHGLLLILGLAPLAIPLVLGPPLATFFRQSQTPDVVGWAFLTFLTVCFGILPAFTVVSGFVRSRRGATIVEVSPRGLTVRERGAWRTKSIASLDAADILDLDYSSRDSVVSSATREAEQQVLRSYPDTPPETSERVERIVARLVRFVTGKGLTVKTRRGLTTIGKGLDDAEVRYLHSVIMNALIG